MRIYAHLRRFVAAGLVASVSCSGCAGTQYYAQSDLRERVSRVPNVALVMVDVRVASQGLGGEVFSGEWSETARNNLRSAVAKHFGSDPRFTIREFDPRVAGEAAQQELQRVRNAMDDIFPTKIDQGVACLPESAPALTEGTDTDILLLAYGSDRIKTAGFRAALVIGAVLVVPLLVVLVGLVVGLLFGAPMAITGANDAPISTLVESAPPAPAPAGLRLAALKAITLCLVDGRRGDTLWFGLETIGTGNLRDASDVDRLIGTAYRKFRESTHADR